jgi:hypothetical protein
LVVLLEKKVEKICWKIRDHHWSSIFKGKYVIFLNNNFFPKSQKGNEIWTFLKMSKNENLKRVLKMGQKHDCDGDDHHYFFCEKNVLR